MKYSCVPLGELVTISGGGTPSRNNDAYWGGNIPWATVKDLKDTTLSGTQEDYNWGRTKSTYHNHLKIRRNWPLILTLEVRFYRQK
jgi:restriction endonuclease S subunit